MDWLRRPRLLTLLWALLCAPACNKVLDINGTQCRTDLDCLGFEHAVCDVDKGVCVVGASPLDAGPTVATLPSDAQCFEVGSEGSPAVAVDSGGETGTEVAGQPRDVDAALATDLGPPSCQGTHGCFLCTPSNDIEFLSTCTDSICVPFDNGARLTNLNADGTLRPLP